MLKHVFVLELVPISIHELLSKEFACLNGLRIRIPLF
jgi:hypothetical protein